MNETLELCIYQLSATELENIDGGLDWNGLGGLAASGGGTLMGTAAGMKWGATVGSVGGPVGGLIGGVLGGIVGYGIYTLFD